LNGPAPATGASSPLTVAPAPAGGRIVELDALRGLAVVGIVLMNVFAFAMPGAAYYNPRAWGGDGPVERALWTLAFLLVEDKFRTLFAMMFGAGVAILLGRPGARRLRAHYARMAVLFAIGFVHATLLYSGDVLRLYAICGLLLPLCARWPARRLGLAAAVLVAVHMLAGGWIGWGWLRYWWQFATVPGTDPAPLTPAEAAFGADPAALARGLELGRESFADRVQRRLAAPGPALLAAGLFLPLTLASMLAGMALWRSGLLAARWAPTRAVRLAWWLAVPALVGLGALAALAHWSGFHGAVIGTSALVWSAPLDLMLGIAWAAMAMAWFQARGPSDATVARFAAAGRMALSNYLATSLILGFVFASWGLGLFGRSGRIGTYAIALVPIAAMLLWSKPWLARFGTGPAEWLWRRAARVLGRGPQRS